MLQDDSLPSGPPLPPLGPGPPSMLGAKSSSPLGPPLAAPWPGTEPRSLLVNASSGSLVSGAASPEKPSLTPSPE